MCFDDGENYTTRVRVSDGVRHTEEYTRPRHGMSWRRRNGLGGSYYPSKYYISPPRGHMSSALRHQYRQPHRYGYSQYNNYPSSVVHGGYMGYSSGYGRYYPDNRVAMPRHAAMVSALFPFFSACFTWCLPFSTPLHSIGLEGNRQIHNCSDLQFGCLP
jgi:hypothetical protein